MDTTKLFKYNKITGYWNYVRTCDLTVAKEWLAYFQKTEPNETFKLSKNKPRLPKSIFAS
jgi:hypothetical protein